LSSKKLLACLVYTRFITGFNAFLFHKKLLIQKNLFLNRLGIIKSTFFWNYKLNFINQLLKLKILGLYCNLIIYLYTSNKVKVNLKSIMEKWDGILHFPFHFKYNSIQIQKVFIIFISFLFVKSSLLNNYINIIIKKTKNKKHIKNLIVFFSSLKLIFDKQFVPLLGLKFKIAGRLDGKLRKASYGYKLGSMRLLSLALNLDYSCDILYTQYGSFSLKLWLGNKSSSLA